MKGKKFLYYFFCIFFLSFFLGYQPLAMHYVGDEGGENNVYNASPLPSPRERENQANPYDMSPLASPRGGKEGEETPHRSQDNSILSKMQSIYQATSAGFPWTWKESLAGLSAGVPAAFSGLPFTALCTLGAAWVGIPIPPAGTWEYYATMTAFGAPPCYAVASAVYEGGPAIVKSVGDGLHAARRSINFAWKAAMRCWDSSEEDDETGSGEAEPENKQACYTIMWTDFKENWLSFSLKPKVYSWITAGGMTLFYCGFYFDFLMTLEAKHYEKDPKLGEIWGYTFATLSVPFTWYIFVYSTRNPHTHPYRHLSKDDRVYVNKISQVQDILRKSRGYFLRGSLPKTLRNLDENWDITVAPSNNTLKQAMNDIIQESVSPLRDDIFQDSDSLLMYNIIPESDFPLYEESWRHKSTVCSTWASFGLGIYNTCVMKPLIVYFLLHKFLAARGLSGEALELASGIPTGLSVTLLALITARTLSLSQKEIYRWLDWGLKSEGSPGYWGERLDLLLARWCSLITMGLPTAFYLKREVLNLPYLNDYSSLQYCLIVPFVAFDIMPAASLFYETQFNKIANWCARGAPFYGYRLSCCYGDNEDRMLKPLSFSLLSNFKDQEIALRLMRRLEVAKREFDMSNDKDLKIFANERLAWTGEENAPLIENDL
jgi:hypothetical protein